MQACSLGLSYEGYGICQRDYPRAVRVVDDAVDLVANVLQAHHRLHSNPVSTNRTVARSKGTRSEMH